MKKCRKQHQNWLSVIWITIFYDLFVHTSSSKDIAYNKEWLDELLTALGKLRRNKVLKIWFPIKFIIIGLIFAVIIIGIGLSDIITTILILLDIIVVAISIWANR